VLLEFISTGIDVVCRVGSISDHPDMQALNSSCTVLLQSFTIILQFPCKINLKEAARVSITPSPSAFVPVALRFGTLLGIYRPFDGGL
jgi:hypothetical protein